MSGTLENVRPTVAPVVRQIQALTGVRIIAALWVVVFHLRGNIAAEFPALYSVLAPIITHGDYGVDLFFIVSGYVITLNYGRRMGIGVERNATMKFWWARLSRVWPAYFVVLLFTSVWHGAFLVFDSNDPVTPRDFSVWSFIRQATLTVQWTESDFDRLTWNGAAWSVSVEAFAYLLFPVIALLLFRMAGVLRARSLGVIALLTVMPVVLFALALGSLYAPWMWLIRILCEFIAGGLLFYALEDVQSRRTAQRIADWVAPGIIVAFLVGAYVLSITGHDRWGVFVVPALVVFVGSLVVARRGIVTLLSLRWFVVGGMASYSVYLVHMPLIEIFWATQARVAFLAPGTLGSKVILLLIPVVVTGAGFALWKWFEEPARRVMRRMSLQHIPERAVDDVPIGQAGLAVPRPQHEGRIPARELPQHPAS